MTTETEVPSCMRCYHVYKNGWAMAVGKLVMCSREPTKASDRYAVVVIKDRTIIVHLPRRMCKVYSVFLRKGGLISCKVTGLKRSHSKYPNEKNFRKKKKFVVQ